MVTKAEEFCSKGEDSEPAPPGEASEPLVRGVGAHVSVLKSSFSRSTLLQLSFSPPLLTCSARDIDVRADR